MAHAFLPEINMHTVVIMDLTYFKHFKGEWNHFNFQLRPNGNVRVTTGQVIELLPISDTASTDSENTTANNNTTNNQQAHHPANFHSPEPRVIDLVSFNIRIFLHLII